MEGEGKNQGGSGIVCRQSSSRWTPTTDQIRILKELYYNNGVRSPTAEQIQRISAKLRQYGKIEGKNVFYWFQNHKARERQKKRFIAPLPPPPPPPLHYSSWKNHEDVHCSTAHGNGNNKFTLNNNLTPAGNFPSSSSSSTGFLNMGSVGNYGGYGRVAMEKSFRECSINSIGPSMGHNFSWIGVNDPCISSVPYPFLENRRFFNEEQTLDYNFLDEQYENQETEAEAEAEIETLPLFPMHGDFTYNKQQETDCFNGWTRGLSSDGNSINGGGPRASLELTLNFP